MLERSKRIATEIEQAAEESWNTTVSGCIFFGKVNNGEGHAVRPTRTVFQQSNSIFARYVLQQFAFIYSCLGTTFRLEF